MTTWREVRGKSSEAVGETLQRLAGQVPPGQDIVELGVYLGRTVCSLGSAAGPGVHVWGVDPWDLQGDGDVARTAAVAGRPKRKHVRHASVDVRRAAYKAVHDCGLDESVTLLRDWSVEAAGKYAGQSVGLLFVDGDHSQAGRDVQAWWPHLADGAVVVFDDYSPRFAPVVRDVDELLGSGRLELVSVHDGRLVVTRVP